MEKELILPILKRILVLLSQEKYTVLVELDWGKNMQSDEIKRAIEEYGGKFTMPDDNVLIEQMEVFKTEKPNRFYIDSPIWIDSERSDLTLSVVMIKTDSDIEFTLKDIHIL